MAVLALEEPCMSVNKGTPVWEMCSVGKSALGDGNCAENLNDVISAEKI